MATNYVISENKEQDTRLVTNKYPYPDFEQAVHAVGMSISHKTDPDSFSAQELVHQANMVQQCATKLNRTAYTQEHFTNDGPLAGQTVGHWYTQFISFEKEPISMPERMAQYKHAKITDAASAFVALKEKLSREEDEQAPHYILKNQHSARAMHVL